MGERAQCPRCGRDVAVREPAGGDGSARVPRRHKTTTGQQCDGHCSVVDWSTFYDTNDLSDAGGRVEP